MRILSLYHTRTSWEKHAAHKSPLEENMKSVLQVKDIIFTHSCNVMSFHHKTPVTMHNSSLSFFCLKMVWYLTPKLPGSLWKFLIWEAKPLGFFFLFYYHHFMIHFHRSRDFSYALPNSLPPNHLVLTQLAKKCDSAVNFNFGSLWGKSENRMCIAIEGKHSKW